MIIEFAWLSPPSVRQFWTHKRDKKKKSEVLDVYNLYIAAQTGQKKYMSYWHTAIDSGQEYKTYIVLNAGMVATRKF